ncbi:MAG: exodeoxyribonuclease VII small subunit, partial [Clostridia bacterium]|nr:exodeoxyribonuclease VII small subunit [Clostridia bacterium]
SFEDSVKRLEEIVRHLEAGDLPLEASLALFEEGTGLISLIDFIIL